MTPKKTNGFTIIEIMFVILCIGIISAIGIVSWSSLNATAKDISREKDVLQWVTIFDLYKSRYTTWPLLPNGASSVTASCLGMPLGSDGIAILSKCGEYTGSGNVSLPATTANTIIDSAKNLGKEPLNTGSATKSKASGPMAYIWRNYNPSTNTYTVNGAFIGFFEKSCPKNFIALSTIISTPGHISSGSFSLSQLNTNMNAVGIKACGVVKSITYSPS